MDAELKTLLEFIVSKVGQIDEIRAKVDQIDEIRAKVDQIDEIRARVGRIEETLPTLATKVDIARLEDEQRQIKEMLGVVRLREIGRLDGRIDQLTTMFQNLTKNNAA